MRGDVRPTHGPPATAVVVLISLGTLESFSANGSIIEGPTSLPCIEAELRSFACPCRWQRRNRRDNRRDQVKCRHLSQERHGNNCSGIELRADL